MPAGRDRLCAVVHPESGLFSSDDGMPGTGPVRDSHECGCAGLQFGLFGVCVWSWAGRRTDCQWAGAETALANGGDVFQVFSSA